MIFGIFSAIGRACCAISFRELPWPARLPPFAFIVDILPPLACWRTPRRVAAGLEAEAWRAIYRHAAPGKMAKGPGAGAADKISILAMASLTLRLADCSPLPALPSPIAASRRKRLAFAYVCGDAGSNGARSWRRARTFVISPLVDDFGIGTQRLSLRLGHTPLGEKCFEGGRCGWGYARFRRGADF